MRPGILVQPGTLKRLDPQAESQASGARGFDVELEVQADHPLFDGHFEGCPIFPGVGQIELVLELIGYATGTQPALCGVERCKFLAILAPGTTVRATIELETRRECGVELKPGGSREPQDQAAAAIWTLSDATGGEARVYSRGRLLYYKDGDAVAR